MEEGTKTTSSVELEATSDAAMVCRGLGVNPHQCHIRVLYSNRLACIYIYISTGRLEAILLELSRLVQLLGQDGRNRIGPRTNGISLTPEEG